MADFCKIDFFKWTLSFTFVYAVSLLFILSILQYSYCRKAKKMSKWKKNEKTKTFLKKKEWCYEINL